jgi:hypothetical protein
MGPPLTDMHIACQQQCRLSDVFRQYSIEPDPKHGRSPVGARVVAEPAGYGWSCHRAKARDDDAPVVTAHASFLSLGPDPSVRLEARPPCVRPTMGVDATRAIREATQFERPPGADACRQHVEERMGPRASHRPSVARGRPARCARLRRRPTLKPGRSPRIGIRSEMCTLHFARSRGAFPDQCLAWPISAARKERRCLRLRTCTRCSR